MFLAFDRSRLIDICLSLLLVAGTFAIYLLSPVRSLGETQYTLMLGHTVLNHRTFALDRKELHLPDQLEMIGNTTKVKVLPLEMVNGKVYKYAPPGSTLLSLPFIEVASWFGLTPVDANGFYDGRRELRLSAILAALLMALFAFVCFWFSRLLLPIGASLAVTLSACLGTQLWSTASRVVEPDSWSVWLMMIVLYWLAAHELRKSTLRPVLLGTVLSCCYFVQPTTSISIIAITVYIWLYHRAYFLRLILTGCAWIFVLMIYSWHNFHQLLPNYFKANRLGFETFWEALPGNLISPSRGLFIYVPVLIALGVLLVYCRQQLPLKRLVITGTIVIVVHLLVISGFSHWWAGHSYGPRYWTSVVPWFVLLSVCAVHAVPRRFGVRTLSSISQVAALAVLAFVGILIHARGALSQETRVWNAKPYDIDFREGRLWDWRYPQFLAGLVSPPLPAARYPLLPLNARIDLTKDAADGFLWYGWSNPEVTIRWTDGRQAAFTFALETLQPLTATIRATPFVANGLKGQQRFSFMLNGNVLLTVTLDGASSRDLVFKIPQQALKSQNILLIECPDAEAPAHLGLSEDHRLLGLAVESIQVNTD